MMLKIILKMFNKVLITHQTGPSGKTVKRVYIEESSEIKNELYLSCLVDRGKGSITFISSSEGGMDIENVAKGFTSKNYVKVSLDFDENLSEEKLIKILNPFKLDQKNLEDGKQIVNSILKIILEKDATLIEINPLIINKDNRLICLDAKINFDDNALYRQPDILNLRDLNEESLSEIEASKYDLKTLIFKLNGNIGCMVNGAGLAMATMDIIKLYGEEPANFLDVGGGATKKKSQLLLNISIDENVKGILINIFGGIMRCDVLAQGLIEAANEMNLKIPLVVRLAGTIKRGKKILNDSGLKILSANDLSNVSKKIMKHEIK